MAVSSDEEKRDELSRLIRESKNKGQEISKEGGKVVQFGQEVYDLADASEEALKYFRYEVPSIEQKLQAWGYVNSQGDAILSKMRGTLLPTTMSSSSTASYSMADFAIPENITRFVPPDRQNEASIAVQRLSYVIDRQAEKGKVLSILREYGFTSTTPSRKSPAKQYEMAWAAFERPVTQEIPASTSLIPMRECINGIIAELLRRRPLQERATNKRNKMLSILHQLARRDIPESAIESLIWRWENLHDELSGSKDKNYSRPQWRDCIRRASLFLIEFLQSLDQSKMT